MPRLTERRSRQTRSDIERAAIGLFAATGYDDVTMEQVADAAGVSRRTAYRHFPNKFDLVFEQPRLWLVHFDEVVTSRAAGEPTRTLCRRGLLSVAALIQETADDMIAAWRVFEGNEVLRAHNAKTQATWLDAYVRLLLPDVAQREGAELEVLTLAGSLVSMTNALCVVWAAAHPNGDMVELTRTALDHVDPLWPAESRLAG